jgi:hypothetical protein
MDIFTTALTRVVSLPIKPERLRVKALSKEPATNELTDDIDHFENHEQYVDLSKDSSEKKKNKQNKNKKIKPVGEVTEVSDHTKNSLSNNEAKAITQKEELIHPKIEQNNLDDDIKHLDIYI